MLKEETTSSDDLGLSIDMLDVARLRDWARLIRENGSDMSYWASYHHVASTLDILATNLECAVRDIGALRERRAASAQALTEARQVLALTAVQKRPNPALVRLAQAVVDLAGVHGSGEPVGSVR